jgi:hypothetical protein
MYKLPRSHFVPVKLAGKLPIFITSWLRHQAGRRRKKHKQHVYCG